MVKNNKTFIRITNSDIYDKLENIEKKLTTIEMHVVETNGKVKLNSILSKTALALSILALSIITGINLIGIL